ncbi:hypothetical protein F2Q69_00009063 [Brassica cretica]|uniref:DOG1 domain-containing protein n=1 Tax=Brassica cretica TaxID=69181 RepID=A0A8S9P6G5_BRACR|nr:hypothetical protein F2Q69_00009063 [Brassica cretica]
MASSSSSSYGIEQLQKECYYEWMSLQAKHIVDLKEALMRQRSNAYNHYKLEELVGKIVNDFQSYAKRRSELTDKSCSSYFAPSWNSSLENGLLWMGGCRPSSFVRVIYALCGSCAETHLSRYLLQMDENIDDGHDGDSSMSDLTATQLEKINDLHVKVIREEDEITKKCANLQEDVADMPIAVTAFWRDSVEADADKVRLETLRRIVEVLTPVQAAEFLLSGKRLHMSLREWGRAREERRYGCVHVRMQQQGEPEPGSQRDRTLLIFVLGDVDEVETEPSSSFNLTRGGRESKPPIKYQSLEWKTVRGRDDQNDEKRRKAMTLFTASPLASVVFSVRRPIETSTDDDCLGPHGVSSGFSRLLCQKTDRNQHGRRLSRSSRRLLRLFSSSPSEDRSKPTMDDDSLGPHDVSFGLEILSGV